MSRLLAITLTAGILAVCAGTAQASIQAGDIVNFQRLNPNPVGNFSGGPFALREWNATMTSTGSVLHNSICLERNEYLSLGVNSKFRVTGISNAATSGGLGGPNPDPLDEQTQFLYYQYATGNLGSFDLDPFSAAFNSPTFFDDTTSDSNRALQNAIWTLEEEGTAGLTGNSSDFMDALLALAAANVGGSNEPWQSRVRVLNLEYLNGANAQDQVVLMPVPEATTLAIWSMLSLIGLGACNRRRNR